jgi:hypothetical protein
MQGYVSGKPKPSMEIVVDAAVLQRPTPKPQRVEKTIASCAGFPIKALHVSEKTSSGRRKNGGVRFSDPALH